MTIKRRIKFISLAIILTLSFLIFLILIDNASNELTDFEVDSIIKSNKNKIVNSLLLDDYEEIGYYNEKIQLILKQLPKEVIIELGNNLNTHDYVTLEKVIKKLNNKEINIIATLFKNLNASEIRRLIYIIDKIGIERSIELIDIMLVLPITYQKRIISVMFDLTLTRLIKFIDIISQFKNFYCYNILDVISKSNNPNRLIDSLLLIPLKYYDDLFFKLLEYSSKKIDLLLDIIEKLDFYTVEKIVKLVIKLDINNQHKLLDIILLVEYNDMELIIDSFFDMNNEHIIRAMELIEIDNRLLGKGLELSKRIRIHLSKKEYVATLERSINTASRVDKETRYSGLKIIEEDVRSVAIRRVMKQVDGNPNVYTSNIITELINKDYHFVHDKKTFVDIVSSSSGVIHDYRDNDKEVEQERKFEVIKRFYEGDLNYRKDDVLKFYDINPPRVRYIKNKDGYAIETDFDILNPIKLEEDVIDKQ
jgi:hypothetical protein